MESQADKCTVSTQEAVALPLKDSEKEIISKHKEKLKSNDIAVSLTEEKDDKGESIFKIGGKRGSDNEKLQLYAAALCNATGTSDVKFAGSIYCSCLYTILGSIKDTKQLVEKSEELLYALNSFKPADGFEGMLISRLIALHFQSMSFLRRSNLDDQTTLGTDLNVNRSTKLMRVYNETLDALMRYRRKGEQKVVVQHVQVNDGGKAVVSGQIISEGDVK